MSDTQPHQLCKLITSRELETILNAHDGWAEADRRKPQPTFPWIELGNRMVRYRADVVQQILEQKTVAA